MAKSGVSYSWETVAVEVSEEIIRMGFIQTEGLLPCMTAICQLQPAAAEVTSEAAPGAAVESVLETPLKKWALQSNSMGKSDQKVLASGVLHG